MSSHTGISEEAAAFAFTWAIHLKTLRTAVVITIVGAIGVIGFFDVWRLSLDVEPMWIALAVAGGIGIFGRLFLMLWYRSGGVEVTITASGLCIKIRLPSRSKHYAIELVGRL